MKNKSKQVFQVKHSSKEVFQDFIVFLVLLGACVFASIGLFYAYRLEPLPLLFEAEIEANASEYNLDKSLVAAVCFAESTFRESVISPKGAVGVMQLLPSTAIWIADKIDYTFSVEDLVKADVNIHLGCAYLSYLSEKFDNEKTVLCAYNAGEGTVSTWLLSEEYSCDGKQVSSIPYSETAGYVTKVQDAKTRYIKQENW